MRKKWLPVIACSIILTLTACGMQENKRSEDYESNDGKMNAGTVTGEAGFQEFQKTASIEETILYNSDDILITAGFFAGAYDMDEYEIVFTDK